MKFSTSTSIILFSAAGLSDARPFNLASFDIAGFFSSIPRPTNGFIGLPGLGGVAISGLPTGAATTTRTRTTTTGFGFNPSATATGTQRATRITSSTRRATASNRIGNTGAIVPTLTSVPNNGAPGSNERLLSLSILSSVAGGGGGGRPTRVVAIAEATLSDAEPTPTQSTEESGAEELAIADCTAQSTEGGDTENGVMDNTCCTDLTVIFARGTGEPGNVGVVAGPPMFAALRKKLGEGRVTVQGVDYPADSAGNPVLGAAGGPTLASSVRTARSQCPNTKIIVSGYSQGAMVGHNGLNVQGLAAASSESGIVGAVLFGDPLLSSKIGDLREDQIKQFCGTEDDVCGKGDNPEGGHTSYGSVAEEAADFAIAVAGLA